MNTMNNSGSKDGSLFLVHEYSLQRDSLDDDPVQLGEAIADSESLVPPSMSYNIKAVVSFLQLSSAAVAVVEIAWPSGFRVVVDGLSFVNFDFLPWGSLGRVVKVLLPQKLWVL